MTTTLPRLAFPAPTSLITAPADNGGAGAVISGRLPYRRPELRSRHCTHKWVSTHPQFDECMGTCGGVRLVGGAA